eukprot:12745771-Alexandrium_andersonii.AAC.1
MASARRIAQGPHSPHLGPLDVGLQQIRKRARTTWRRPRCENGLACQTRGLHLESARAHGCQGNAMQM